MAVKGDILPGWSVQEDATSVDILDTSGSTGGVSASFRRIPETVANTPNQGPVQSSEFLIDQSVSFQHETLGSLFGYITDQNSSDGVVSVDMSTVLDFLNQDVDAPTFIDGSPFYSFSVSANMSNAYDMLVDYSGNIWVASNGQYAFQYDRWGSPIGQAYFGSSSNLLRIGIDSSGNLYGMSALRVVKWDATTHANTTIITASSGSFFDMSINAATGMIYLLTNDTTLHAAVKKYNLSGTLQTSWGSNNPSLGTPTPDTFGNILGIGTNTNGSQVFVATGTALNFSVGYAVDIQVFSASGAYSSTITYSTNLDYNDIRMKPATSATGGPMMLTLSAIGIDYSSGSPGGTSIINRDITMPRNGSAVAPFGQMAIAADPNGFGFYVVKGTTVTRLAGGKLSPYQAFECYLGLGGFGVVRPGSVNYTNLTTSQLNTFDGGYFPAWSGNLWTMLKQLGARTGFYMTTSGVTINVTSIKGTLPRIDVSNKGGSANKKVETASGRFVNVTNLNSVSAKAANINLYSSIPSDSVISADYNETNTTTINSNSYPVSIDPINNLQGTVWSPIGSVYMVSDSSNPPLLLSTGQFTAAGGSVTARASNTPGSIDVTMAGPKVAIAGFTAPFSLAYPVGSQKVPALSIVGNGVIVQPQLITIGTGANTVITSEENIPSITSPFINNGSIAYDTAQPACLRMGSGDLTLNLSIPIKPEHTLGSIAGAIFLYQRTKWRVTSAKISEGFIDITAKRFTTVADVTPNNPTMTVGQMDALWSGYRYEDRFLSPGIITQ